MRCCIRGTREEVPETAHKAELTDQSREALARGGGGERNGEKMVKGHTLAVIS